MKQYRLYYPPGISPDSIIVDISYDTLGRSILLKQDFTGSGPTGWSKYQYNALGLLTSVFDITPGSGPGQLTDSFTYDGNNDLAACLTYENKTIPYTTSYSSAGKSVIMYDTSLSGYLGGTVFGRGTILYNPQNQLTDRYLNYGGNAQTSAVIQDHETFSYDGSGNISAYSLNQNSNFIDGNGNPDSSSFTNTESYTQRDIRGNELYAFDSLLLHGVTNLLGGNALIDPLGNVIGYSKTMFFQSQESALLQGSFENGYQYSNLPAFDSLGRLTHTTLYDSQMPGIINVFLSYY